MNFWVVAVVKRYLDSFTYKTEGSKHNGWMQAKWVWNNIRHSLFQLNVNFVQFTGLQWQVCVFWRSEIFSWRTNFVKKGWCDLLKKLCGNSVKTLDGTDKPALVPAWQQCWICRLLTGSHGAYWVGRLYHAAVLFPALPGCGTKHPPSCWKGVGSCSETPAWAMLSVSSKKICFGWFLFSLRASSPNHFLAQDISLILP